MGLPLAIRPPPVACLANVQPLQRDDHPAGHFTTKEEVDAWLSAPYEQATKLQRPLPDSLTTIVPAPVPVEDVAGPTKTPEQPSSFLGLPNSKPVQQRL